MNISKNVLDVTDMMRAVIMDALLKMDVVTWLNVIQRTLTFNCCNPLQRKNEKYVYRRSIIKVVESSIESIS
jgi:hypothetical protein